MSFLADLYRSPKYLIVCDGGNVRSPALAYHLKWHKKREAIAIGRRYTSPETMKMLSEWADKIVLMQEHMIESIPKNAHHKCAVIDVGKDRWGIRIPPELNEMVKEGADWLMEQEEA